MNIGERLREARESENISLEQLQDKTKIQKRYLVAIEEGNFDLLPGTFYARAFIKEYALAVGLNPNTLLAEHADELPTSVEDLDKQYSRMERTRRRSRSSADSSAIFSLIPRIIVILLIIGIIFIAWTLFQKTLGDDSGPVQDENDSGAIIREPREDDTSPIDEEEPDEEIEESDDSTEDDATDETENEADTDGDISFDITPGTGTTPESTVIVNFTDDELVLRFEASGSSWLAVDTDTGESLYNQEISADESSVEFEITDNDEVYLNIGNSPALDIFLNDESLEYPVDATDRVHQKIVLQINKQ